MKRIYIYKIIYFIWLLFSILLFVFLVYNYINSLDIIKYRIESYSYTKETTIRVNLDEVMIAVESFKLINTISIVYIGITCAFLFMFYDKTRHK